MKKHIIKLLSILLLIVSCEQEKFFEFERPSQSPWNNITEFERSVIGAYSVCFSGGWGNSWPVIKIFKNMVADDIATSTPNDPSWGWFRDTENNNKMIHQTTYIKYYQAIAICNDALDFINENNGDPYPKISEDDRKYNFNRIVGELYFMRGYCYYTLATLFGDAYVPDGDNKGKQLPLRTTFSRGADEALSPKIATTEELWDQILSDLKMAYDMLPERYLQGKMHVSYSAGRANKFAASAMLSRAYFYMGNYAEAKDYSDYVITKNGGDYYLEEPIDAFNKSTLTSGKESIFWLPFYDQTKDTPPYFAGVYSHLCGGDPCTWVSVIMDFSTLQRIGWMPNPKSDTTITIVARRDKRFQQLFFVREPANVPLELQVKGKYYETRANLTYRTVLENKTFRGPGGRANYPEIRLAEMYLTRCICQFKAGNKSAAANDINIIRKRAWDERIAGISYENSSSYVTESTISEQMINDERLIELFCEGDRIDYLRGLKVNVGNGERGSGSLPYTDKGFVWSLPQGEIDYNKSLN
ncbi:MAG: RagB/SusD family nutrient uptake outer membrane protein [Prolixibacteraceae bacterium]|nr:RagB/SusD family nutrient uptake outer membrane protein [Prolixibacteraceae bacterium]